MRDSEAHWRRNAGTWKLCSEDCNNFYCIESVENCADELKAIFFACWNNQVNWAARKDLSKTRSSRLVSYLLFKVTQKVLSFPSISIFTSVKNHFDTRRELCTVSMTGTFTRWLVICWTAASGTIKNWMLARNTSRHVSFTLQPVELRICCHGKIAKLAGSISVARAGQPACCLSSFF